MNADSHQITKLYESVANLGPLGQNSSAGPGSPVVMNVTTGFANIDKDEDNESVKSHPISQHTSKILGAFEDLLQHKGLSGNQRVKLEELKGIVTDKLKAITGGHQT